MYSCSLCRPRSVITSSSGSVGPSGAGTPESPQAFRTGMPALGQLLHAPGVSLFPLFLHTGRGGYTLYYAVDSLILGGKMHTYTQHGRHHNLMLSINGVVKHGREKGNIYAQL